MSGRASRWRVAAAFALLFLVYQAAEAMQSWPPLRSAWGPAVMVLALLLAWPVGRWLGWRGYDAYALDLRPASFAYLVGGFVLAGVAKFAAVEIGLATGAYRHIDLIVPSAFSIVTLIGLGLLSTFIPSLIEDILTRGFPLRATGIRWSGPAFVVASAALYTLNHVWRLDWGWTEQVRLFCLGLAYAAAAWRFRTLWAAVALHWGWNFSGAQMDLLLPVDSPDPVAGRWISAGVHLVLLAIVLALPAPKPAENNSTIR